SSVKNCGKTSRRTVRLRRCSVGPCPSQFGQHVLAVRRKQKMDETELVPPRDGQRSYKPSAKNRLPPRKRRSIELNSSRANGFLTNIRRDGLCAVLKMNRRSSSFRGTDSAAISLPLFLVPMLVGRRSSGVLINIDWGGARVGDLIYVFGKASRSTAAGLPNTGGQALLAA